MKKILIALLVAGTAVAHVPVITPSDWDNGGPPDIEPTPLPPIMLRDPVTQAPLIVFPGDL